MTLDPNPPSFIHLPKAGITDLSHHAQLINTLLKLFLALTGGTPEVAGWGGLHRNLASWLGVWGCVGKGPGFALLKERPVEKSQGTVLHSGCSGSNCIVPSHITARCTIAWDVRELLEGRPFVAHGWYPVRTDILKIMAEANSLAFFTLFPGTLSLLLHPRAPEKLQGE